MSERMPTIDLKDFLAQEPHTELLLTVDEEACVSREHGNVPYTYECAYGSKSLLVVGEPHSYGCNALSLGLGNHFVDFHPDFAFVEGKGTLTVHIVNIKDAALAGEPSVVAFL